MPQGEREGNLAIIGRCHKGRQQWQNGGVMLHCKMATLQEEDVAEVGCHNVKK